MIRTCTDCSKEFEGRTPKARLCWACRTKRQRLATKKWQMSERGHSFQRGYRNTKVNVGKRSEYHRHRADRDPELYLWRSARKRAGVKGLLFSIAVADIKIGTHCPCCGAEYERGFGAANSCSPTLDRLRNAHGYTPWNIWVICHQCNARKGGVGPEHLRRLADAIDRQLGIT